MSHLFQNMSGGVYGGDEVGALVFDPGHFSLRVGYAGEDCPKAEIPSYVGTSPDTTEGDEMDTGENVKTKKKFHVDTVMLNYPKKEMEVYLITQYKHSIRSLGIKFHEGWNGIRLGYV